MGCGVRCLSGKFLSHKIGNTKCARHKFVPRATTLVAEMGTLFSKFAFRVCAPIDVFVSWHQNCQKSFQQYASLIHTFSN